MDLKPLTCPNCGGSIDRTRLNCEYCGTKFFFDGERENFKIDIVVDDKAVFNAVRREQERRNKDIFGLDRLHTAIVEMSCKTEELSKSLEEFRKVAKGETET